MTTFDELLAFCGTDISLLRMLENWVDIYKMMLKEKIELIMFHRDSDRITDLRKQMKLLQIELHSEQMRQMEELIYSYKSRNE
jgi:hypothetical protein